MERKLNTTDKEKDNKSVPSTTKNNKIIKTFKLLEDS